MKTFYLVDFENVNNDGLKGCEKLGEEDNIIIFFTSSHRKIDMSIIANHGLATLEMKEVASGDQSADMHIASYAGYLMGIYSGEDITIVVLSEDSDYDTMVKYWNKKPKITFKKAFNIAGEKKKLVEEPKKTSTKKAEKKVEKETEKKEEKNSSEVIELTEEKKKTISEEIRNYLEDAGQDNDVIEYVIPKVLKNVKDKSNGKKKIYDSIISKYKQERTQEIYKPIQKYLGKLFKEIHKQN